MTFRARAIRLLGLLGALGLACWLAAGPGGAAPAQAQADAATRLEIVTVDTSGFPDPVVAVRVVDASGRPVRGLTDFQLLENDQPVATPDVEEVEISASIAVLVLVDQGILSILRYRSYYEDPPTLKGVLQALGDGVLSETDTVCLAVGRADSGTNGRQQMLLPLECGLYSPFDYDQSIAELDIDLAQQFPAGDPRQDVQGVHTAPLFEDALTALAGQPDPVVVFLSAYMVASPEQEGQNPSQATADQVAQAAVAAGARVFVLQAAGNTLAGNPAELQEPMITLARETGGEYVELNVGRDYVNDARAAFGRIRRPDFAYELTYRSADGTPGERRLSVALAGQPELAVEQTVSVAVAPPAADEANLAIDPALDGRRQIRVPIAWPDDFSPRAIRAVTLNGEPIETFDLADGVLTFSIDEMITGDLRLVIEDEVGQTAHLVIQIATPPSPTPTSAPPTATPTPAVVPVAPPSRFTGVWPWLAVLAVAIVAAAAYLGMRRGTLSHIGQGIGEGARRIATIGTAREEKQALAYLLVLTGRDNLIGQNVPLYNEITTIGRDPQLTDIQLYDVSELSSISGQHCTIQVDHGLFLIIDNNSSNGTYVNGEALTPDLPHQLQNGYEIVLGDKARHGAQLRFEISRRALNRFSHTVIDGEWQGGERSGTATTPGPTRGLDRLDDLWPPDEASAEPPAASAGQAE